MGFIKQIMLIGSGNNSINTEEATSISGEFDMDNLGGTLSFKLPYDINSNNNSQFNIKKLKKYDTVKLYFGEFDSKPSNIDIGDGSQTTINGMTKVFDGFIDNIKLTKTKTDIDYSINALSTIALANDRNIPFNVTSDMGNSLIPRYLKLAGLDFIKFESELGADEIAIKIKGGKNLKDLLMQIRERYALIIHQDGDGILRQTSPFVLKEKGGTLTQVDYSFNIEDGNIFNIDYGDLTSDINSLVLLGFPPAFGVALDPIAIQNNNGKVNYEIFENRDIRSPEECEKVARQMLLDIEKNFAISIRTKFIPTFKVGQTFIINDNDKFTGNEIFILKKYSFTINKDDVSATITGYTHGLTFLPKDLVLSNTGIADLDVLEIKEKQIDILGWNKESFD